MLVLPPLADVVDKPRGLIATAGAITLELRPKALNTVVVDHNVEKVFVAQVVEDRLEGLAGLVNLFAGHRSRPVDHEDDGLRLRFDVRDLHLRTGQEEKIAIL